MKTLTHDELNRLEDLEHVASYSEAKLGLDDEPEEEYEVDVYVGRMPDTGRWVVFEELEGFPTRRRGVYRSREQAVERAQFLAELEDGNVL
jgi:hypothetical protein